ncbi:MAG: DUF4199 domain-containing protein [Crocinitomicaceae bacterium]|nr:DUF4199 domain-containing protein [Crocinitomicaceae bacterium]
MKITVKTGVLIALIFVAIKLIFSFAHLSHGDIIPTVLINMFLLLSSISIGLYLHKKKEGFSQGNAMSDIKAGMTTGVSYGIVVVSFIYLFYAYINPGYIETMIQDKLVEYQKGLADPAMLKQIKASNEAFEILDAKQIYQEMENSTRATISAFSITTISMLGMILLSAFYSILVTIIFRKVLLRDIIAAHRNRSRE